MLVVTIFATDILLVEWVTLFNLVEALQQNKIQVSDGPVHFCVAHEFIFQLPKLKDFQVVTWALEIVEDPILLTELALTFPRAFDNQFALKNK